jgi:hypothetical protein
MMIFSISVLRGEEGDKPGWGRCTQRLICASSRHEGVGAVLLYIKMVKIHV